MSLELTYFEDAIVSQAPTFALRLSDDGATQLIYSATSVRAAKPAVAGVLLNPCDGVFGNRSWRFEGSGGASANNYVNIAKHVAIMPTSAITLIAVMSAYRNTGIVSSLISCTQSGGYSLQITPSNGKVLWNVRVGSSYMIVSFDNALLKSDGSLIQATCDGRYIIVSVDGVEVATLDRGSKGTLSYSSSTDLLIGAEPLASTPESGNDYADFDISFCAVFDRALSSADMLANYNTFNTAKIIGGSALLDNGLAASEVLVAPYAGGLVARLAPDTSGEWSASVPPGEYLITALGPAGYRPISHGPVTAVDL